MLDDAVARAIAWGDEGNVFAFLGRHALGDATEVTCFDPWASEVFLVGGTSPTVIARLEPLQDTGLFSCRLPSASVPARYRFLVQLEDRQEIREDPYRFPSCIADQDAWLFNEGQHREAWRFMGAHAREIDGVPGFSFAVWAPNARRVSVVGDFNRWDGRVHVMRRHPASGLWDIFLPGIGVGQIYKFEIKTASGQVFTKIDPYARRTLQPADSVALAWEDHYDWKDPAWMADRGGRQAQGHAVSIYEVHAGSWRRHPDGRYYDWNELADTLIDYALDLGFTHLQLLPISEYPFDGSWGYQPTSLYAPSSRFGAPNGFRSFIDRAHQRGLGVLLDWVPGHFPRDYHALGRFDGTALYEHEDPRRGLHPDWGTFIYNYGRAEVVNFLISNALYWLQEFHIDGLRVDAVASMLYLDYSRRTGDWLPNAQGGRENLEAIAFIKHLSTVVGERFPDALLIAEESTAWPGVSRPVHAGGLGFDYKWNMGWMHDTLSYLARDPAHRKYHHHQMTFSLLYAFSEQFILPLSHDEVVHGKGSLLGKMPGDTWQKHANLRAYLAFMWGHPGKKLLFMGSELAQPQEWNHDHQLAWELQSERLHQGIGKLVRDLNKVYRDLPALHATDADPAGFLWINADDHDNSVYSFIRQHPADDRQLLLVVANFTPVVRNAYRLAVPRGGLWSERLNTDSAFYGGSNQGNSGFVPSRSHKGGASILLTLPPLATLYLTLERAQ